MDIPETLFVSNGNLNIKPVLTADKYNESFVLNGKLDLGKVCYDQPDWGYACKKQANSSDILNPIISGRINTRGKFAFKYGKMVVRALVSSGDWLWPSAWLMPDARGYGRWPRSGEIDLLEARGNSDYRSNTYGQIGVKQMTSTLHFGPSENYTHTVENVTQFRANNARGWNADYVNYTLIWTPTNITFYADDQFIGSVDGSKGFWRIGGFDKQQNFTEIWTNGTQMAPFDKEFCIILNQAVAGGYFGDWGTNYPKPAPWTSKSKYPQTDFWAGKDQWLPTWTDPTFKVDYVRVYAL
jgi:beta-glucanase (GH16 family)